MPVSSNAPHGFLTTQPDCVQFLYFSDDPQGRITGRAQSVKVSPDNDYDTVPQSARISGERSGDTVTLSLGAEEDYTGTIKGDTLTLLVPTSEGELRTVEYTRTTAQGYNKAVRTFQDKLQGQAAESWAAEATAQAGPTGYLGRFPQHVIFYQLEISGGDVTGTAQGSYLTASDPSNPTPIFYYANGTLQGASLNLTLTDRATGEARRNSGTLEGDVMKLRIQSGGLRLTNVYHKATTQDYELAAGYLTSGLHDWHSAANAIYMPVYQPEYLPNYVSTPPAMMLDLEGKYPSLRAEYYGGVTIVETTQKQQLSGEPTQLKNADAAFFGTLDGHRALWSRLNSLSVGIVARNDREMMAIADSLAYVTP